MDFVIGGRGLLLLGGRVLTDDPGENIQAAFSETRHPRTAAGIRPDGRWVLVVVDGRQDSISVGMSLAELAELMLELGCSDALNLDGGGSSTMYFEKVVRNSPSDGRERPISDAILVLPR
jgi:exopolysaccharide biosynthesis protein